MCHNELKSFGVFYPPSTAKTCVIPWVKSFIYYPPDDIYGVKTISFLISNSYFLNIALLIPVIAAFKKVISHYVLPPIESFFTYHLFAYVTG